jgi:hypothetical protein
VPLKVQANVVSPGAYQRTEEVLSLRWKNGEACWPRTPHEPNQDGFSTVVRMVSRGNEGHTERLCNLPQSDKTLIARPGL